MEKINLKKNILWDFDGVILDSMAVRDFGFRKIFEEFTPSDVDELIEYHRLNGGLSRYVKIRYFFENILQQPISEKEVLERANSFSSIMMETLVDPKNLIQDSLIYIKNNFKKYRFHIVSGSDGEELRFLCKKLDIHKYFHTIEGSPTPKKILVKNVIENHQYDIADTCLIGDSINDFEAAEENGIKFYGYNNPELKKVSEMYITYFNEIKGMSN